MSDAGYILDKTPNFELVSSYKGDKLPTTTQGDDWYLSYTGSPANAIVSDSLFLDGSVSSASNTFLSPYNNREKQLDDLLSFKFKLKFDPPVATTSGLNYYAKFHSSNSMVQTLSIYSNTLQVDSLIFYVGSSYYELTTLDTSEFHSFNIFLIGYVWHIYIDGVFITSIDGTASSASTDYCYCEFIPLESASSPVNLYIKDVSMSFNTSYRDGYNNLNSDLITLSCTESQTKFPASNLVNAMPNKAAMFNSNSIEIEMTTALTDSNYSTDLELDSSVLAILGHNITSQAAIIFSYGDSSSSLTDIAIPWSEEEIVYEFSSTISWKYAKLTIVDLNNSGNLLIGELIAGVPVYFSQCFFWNCSFQAEYNKIVLKTDFDLRWNYNFNRIKTVKGIDFKMITDDTVVELYNLFEKANGSSYPILFFWDTRDEDLGIIYGTLMDKYLRKLTFTDVNDVTKLEIHGLPYAKSINDDV